MWEKCEKSCWRPRMEDIMKKLTQQIAIVLTAALVLTGMAGNSAEASKKAGISKSKLTLKVGQTKKLSVKNLKKNQKKKLKWSSSKKKVASVNKNGKVTAKKKGTAKITAKVGKKKYTCKVTVTAEAANATPTPTPTPTPKTKEQLAKEDRENLDVMVKKLVADGAKIDTNLDNMEYYLWDEDGRLNTIRIGDDESTKDYGVKGKIDVSCFTALERLELDCNRGVTEVCVKGITTLKYLSIGYTSVKSVDVSTNPNLERIYCNKDTLVIGASSTVSIGRW